MIHHKIHVVFVGKVLVDHILKILMEYGFTENEVKEHFIFLSDRGPNIKYGLINAGFIRLTCYAHLIHNLVTHMLDHTRVKEMIKKCCALSSYIKNSGLNKKLNTSLKTFTATRWNSVFIMIDAIIKNYQDIYDLLIMKQRLRNESRIKYNQQPDNSISELVTVLNIAEMEIIRIFLEPFKVRIIIIILKNINLIIVELLRITKFAIYTRYVFFRS